MSMAAILARAAETWNAVGLPVRRPHMVETTASGAAGPDGPWTRPYPRGTMKAGARDGVP